MTVGSFATDCANAALRDEVKRLYASIFKKVASKEGDDRAGGCFRGKLPAAVASKLGFDIHSPH